SPSFAFLEKHYEYSLNNHPTDRLHFRVRRCPNRLFKRVKPSGVYWHDHPIHFQRQQVMDGLLRKPFDAQAEVVQAVTALLVDKNESAVVINAEMGTGKTMMAIAAAAVMHA